MSYFDDNEDSITGLNDYRRKHRESAIRWRDPQPGRKAADRTWEMKSGETIRLGDMTQRHRTNCLALLVRRSGPGVLTSAIAQAFIECGVDYIPE